MTNNYVHIVSIVPSHIHTLALPLVLRHKASWKSIRSHKNTLERLEVGFERSCTTLRTSESREKLTMY